MPTYLSPLEREEAQTKREDAYYALHNQAPSIRKAVKYHPKPTAANPVKTPTRLLGLIDPNEQFPQVEKMLYDLAWKCANAYPVTFEEAKSEAYYAFVRSCQDYDPDKSKGAKFSTWCYFWVWTQLKTFVTKRSVDPLIFVEMKEDLLGGKPDLRSESMEMFCDLSDDAKEIIQLLIETPAEILGRNGPVPAKHLLIRVKAYLERAGRDKKTLETAVEEIRLRLRGNVGYCVA